MDLSKIKTRALADTLISWSKWKYSSKYSVAVLVECSYRMLVYSLHSKFLSEENKRLRAKNKLICVENITLKNTVNDMKKEVRVLATRVARNNDAIVGFSRARDDDWYF